VLRWPLKQRLSVHSLCAVASLSPTGVHHDAAAPRDWCAPPLRDSALCGHAARSPP
jgi:hypothetical protein